MPYCIPTEKVKKLYGMFAVDTTSLLLSLFVGDKCDVQHLEDYDFLYFFKKQSKMESWVPSKLDQTVHLLTLKN